MPTVGGVVSFNSSDELRLLDVPPDDFCPPAVSSGEN